VPHSHNSCEMGLDHHHVLVESNTRDGTRGEVRDVFTGYSMCLTPENNKGVEENDMEAHAIEALRVT
jgi:hypothetical protein